MSDPKPEVTLVVESYNVTEASSLERLGTVLGAAARMVAEHGSARLFVTDAAGDPALADLLARELPQAHVVDARGLGYEEAKLKAAQEAESEIVLYLDGDCVPGPGWIEAHLAVLRSKAHATAGFTRYDGGGWQGTIETILDFGFLLPAGDRDLACYSSNNSGFRRSTLLEEPHPDGPMRCRCFAHAQNLLRRGTPVRMVPDARVVHERVPFVSERYRRGFDLVAACWVDRDLREARWLRLGLFATPLFYAQAVALDWRRLFQGRRDLGLPLWQAAASLPLFPAYRLIDLVGIARALGPGGRQAGVGLAPVAE